MPTSDAVSLSDTLREEQSDAVRLWDLISSAAGVAALEIDADYFSVLPARSGSELEEPLSLASAFLCGLPFQQSQL